MKGCYGCLLRRPLPPPPYPPVSLPPFLPSPHPQVWLVNHSKTNPTTMGGRTLTEPTCLAHGDCFVIAGRRFRWEYRECAARRALSGWGSGGVPRASVVAPTCSHLRVS
jgi:hypothetical protein